MNNLKLEFGTKSVDYINSAPYRTRVVLTNDDGAYYPIFFDPEAIEKSDAELYQMALDVVYQKNAYQRAEDERFNLMGTKIAQLDEAKDRADKQYQKMEQFMKTVSQTVNEAIMSLAVGKENVETTSESE